jgi:hypothetical protein
LGVELLATQSRAVKGGTGPTGSMQPPGACAHTHRSSPSRSARSLGCR